MFISALSEAANEPKGPVVLLPRDAKLSPGLMIFMSSTMPGPYVGGWMDKSRYVDYELKVEPGKYRLAVKLVPQGGGYLSAKIDEGQAIRRQVVRSRRPVYTPIEVKYGEVDIPNAGARLRFTGDKLVGDRFTSLRTLLGDAFVAVEFPSEKKSDHSVLTEQRRQEGVGGSPCEVCNHSKVRQNSQLVVRKGTGQEVTRHITGRGVPTDARGGGGAVVTIRDVQIWDVVKSLFDQFNICRIIDDP